MTSSSHLKILYVSPPWPYQSIRSRHLALALSKLGRVDRAIVHSERENNEPVRDEGDGFEVIQELHVATRPRRSPIDKIASVARPGGSYPHGIGVAPEDEQKLLLISQRYDLLWFFKFRTSNAFSHRTWPKTVLDVDDVPSGYLESSLSSATGLASRLAVHFHIQVWKRREALIPKRFSRLCVCSEADARRFSRAENRVHVIPNGFSRPAQVPARNLTQPPRIGFIGMFNYAPNVEGVRWFIEHCWPHVASIVPDARLRLIGRGSEEMFSGPGIDGLGWVDDSASEIATWSAMIIPLSKGAGTRVKIAEAFSRKCPVISTRIGAYGYDVKDGLQLRLADDPISFANACVELIRDPQKGERMVERAWNDFLTKWSWEAISPRVWKVAEEAVRDTRSCADTSAIPSMAK